MESFEYPYNESDVGKLTDKHGNALFVSGQLLRQIARQAAPTLALEELAVILRKVADDTWAHAGRLTEQKILASDVHKLAAELQALDAKLHAYQSIPR